MIDLHIPGYACFQQGQHKVSPGQHSGGGGGGGRGWRSKKQDKGGKCRDSNSTLFSAHLSTGV